MGTTGVIFAAIAIAWLAYLVPHFVRKREDETLADDPAERFSESVRVVQRGTAPLLDQDLEEIGFEVSTPLTRRAAINDLRRVERLAASRRRRVLIALLALVSATIGVRAFQLLPWWSVAVPAGLLLGFVVVARFSVRAMRRSLDRRHARIVAGGVEETVFLRQEAVSRAIKSAEPPVTEKTSVVPAAAGKLWDPIPVTTATYVSKPLTPRTVRTIDLSGPALTPSAPAGPPVTADAPVSAPKPAAEESGNDRRAASA